MPLSPTRYIVSEAEQSQTQDLHNGLTESFVCTCGELRNRVRSCEKAMYVHVSPAYHRFVELPEDPIFWIMCEDDCIFEIVPSYIVPYAFYGNPEEGNRGIISFQGEEVTLTKSDNRYLHEFSWGEGFCSETKWKLPENRDLLSSEIIQNSMMGCCLMIEILDREENLTSELRFRIGIVDPVWQCTNCGKIIPE